MRSENRLRIEHPFDTMAAMDPQLLRALDELDAALADFDPATLVGDEPAEMLRRVVVTERRLASCRARIAHRADEMKVWSRSGARSAAQWVAGIAGTSLHDARAMLETADRLDGQPIVGEAFATGEVSESQAREVAAAAEAAPSRQSELVADARVKSRSELKEKCGRIRRAGGDAEARHRRHVRERHLRTWTDGEGAFRLAGSLPADSGAIVKAALDAGLDEMFRRARKQGRRESLDAYRADALVDLCAGGSAAAPGMGHDQGAGDAGSKKQRRTGRVKHVVHVMVDLEALRRGRTEVDECCEIPGVGPIPTSVVQDILDENAFLTGVLREGVEVRKVLHWGRHIPAEVRTALRVQERTCAVPGCGNPRIEYDHRRARSDEGPTAIWNLDPLCRFHHLQKTHDGYRLAGRPDQRTWYGPDGRALAHDRSPPAGADPPHAAAA